MSEMSRGGGLQSCTRFWGAYCHSRKPFEITLIDGGYYSSYKEDPEEPFADLYDWDGEYLAGAFCSHHYDVVVGWLKGVKHARGRINNLWRAPE